LRFYILHFNIHYVCKQNEPITASPAIIDLPYSYPCHVSANYKCTPNPSLSNRKRLHNEQVHRLTELRIISRS